MRKTIWVTGASGKIGKALVKRLKKNTDYKLVATDTDVDITDIVAVEQHADIYKPHVIINCASISDAAYCEEHEVEAYKVNTLGARNLASISRQRNIKIIQLSTDDVFCGENARSKNEFDVPTPATVYGKSKYAGENFVRELNPKHLIIRSSWVYGAGKDDYLSYVLEKGKNGETFTAPLDKLSTPTSTEQLANVIQALLESRETGIYHVSCEGACTRNEYAKTILALAGYDPMLAIGSYDEGGAIVSTILDNLMMKMTGIYDMPQWQDELKKHIKKED